MVKVPMDLHDIQVLLAAELSVCQWLAEFMAEKLEFPDGIVEEFSASLINGADGEETILFECSVNGGKYGAYLLVYNRFPECSAEHQLYYLRKIKRTYRCREYKELKCCLIVPAWLLEKNPSLTAYPVILIWERLCDLLTEHQGRRGRYLADILRNSLVGRVPFYSYYSPGLVLEY